jgi:hypothetical protein
MHCLLETAWQGNRKVRFGESRLELILASGGSSTLDPYKNRLFRKGGRELCPRQKHSWNLLENTWSDLIFCPSNLKNVSVPRTHCKTFPLNC